MVHSVVQAGDRQLLQSIPESLPDRDDGIKVGADGGIYFVGFERLSHSERSALMPMLGFCWL